MKLLFKLRVLLCGALLASVTPATSAEVLPNNGAGALLTDSWSGGYTIAPSLVSISQAGDETFGAGPWFALSKGAFPTVLLGTTMDTRDPRLGQFAKVVEGQLYLAYTLQASSMVRVQAFDAAGNLIQELMHSQQTPGSYQQVLSLQELSEIQGRLFIKVAIRNPHGNQFQVLSNQQ